VASSLLLVCRNKCSLNKEENMSIEEEYRATRKKSQLLHQRACRVIPEGIQFEIRFMKPFPFYVERAAGARNWDL